MSESKHLSEIMEQHKQIANLQVVFLDVESYSQRRTLTQIQVVDALTKCLASALSEVSKEFVEYAQTNSINFQTDIIRLPTGDGAAFIFTFDGLHDIHLQFAKHVLRLVHAFNSKSPCEKFAANGWCNCHANFNLRIGISEGKGIVFRDLNGSFNVAGGVVNMAARVMGIADRNQIIFTAEAYRQIVDMVNDPNLVDSFKEFSEIQIKHGLKITICQFICPDLEYLNNNPPERAVAEQVMKKVYEKMSASSMLPMVNFDELEKLKKGDAARRMERVVDLMSQINQTLALALSEPVVETKPISVVESEPDKAKRRPDG